MKLKDFFCVIPFFGSLGSIYATENLEQDLCFQHPKVQQDAPKFYLETKKNELDQICRSQKPETLTQFLQDIPDPVIPPLLEVCKENGLTLLHVFCCTYDINEKTIEVLIKFLHQKNQHEFLKSSDYRGYTAFHYACQYGKRFIARTFIQVNPDFLSMTTNHGQTGLHLACAQYETNTALELLGSAVHHVPLLKTEDENGNTPLNLACHYTFSFQLEKSKSFLQALMSYPSICCFVQNCPELDKKIKKILRSNNGQERQNS
jgi:hypothetical protein